MTSNPGGDRYFRPFLGDFNGDGHATPGFFDPNDRTVVLATGDGPFGLDKTESFPVPVGIDGVPVIEDFDGDGTDSIRIFKDGTISFGNRLGQFLLPESVGFGIDGDQPLWLPGPGGTNGPAVFRPADSHIVFENPGQVTIYRQGFEVGDFVVSFSPTPP